MAISQLQLHQLYLAYFGRPADFNGFIYYTSNPAETLQSAAEGFSKSEESIELYGKDFGAKQINDIYMNLFGRPAEVAGLVYWLTEVNSGRLSPAMAAWAILHGAQNDDKIVVDKKMAISQAFYAALNTTAEIIGYSGDAAAAIVFEYLKTVTKDTNLEDALDEIDQLVAEATNTTPPEPPVGTPEEEAEEPAAELPEEFDFEFGNKADTLTGTGDAEIFFGVIGGSDATVQAGDKATGGAEDDTLILQIEGDTKNVVPAFSTEAIETIRIRNLSGKDQTVDASQFKGAEVFAGDYSSGRVYVTKMAEGQAGATLVNASNHNALLSFEYAAGAKAAELLLMGAKNDVVQIGGADVEETTVTVHAAEENTLAHLVLTGAKNKALTIDATDGDVEIRNIAAVAGTEVVLVSEAPADDELAPGSIKLGSLVGVTKVDASDAEGTVEIHADSKAAFVDTFNYVGGKGSDMYHVRGALKSGVIDGGDGAEGEDVLYIHGAFVTSKAQADMYKNFETIAIGDGVTQNVSFFGSNAGLAIFDGDADAGTKLTNVSKAQAQTGITIMAAQGDKGAISIAVEGVTGDADELSLGIGSGADAEATFNLGNLAVEGIEILDLYGNVGEVVVTSLTGVTKLQEFFAGGDAAFNVTTGAIDIGLIEGNVPLFDFVDVEGGVTFDASAAQATATNGLEFLGSSTAANTIKDSAKGDVIVGGEAADSVTYQGGGDLVELDAAGDTFNFNGKSGAALGGGDGPIFVIVNTGTASDSKAAQAASDVFDAQNAFDAAVTDTISGITAGVKFMIRGLDDPQAEVRVEEVDGFTFGQDDDDLVDEGGWLIVRADANATQAFAFHDSNGDGDIDKTDVMVRLVGTVDFSDDELFSLDDNGNLLFFAGVTTP